MENKIETVVEGTEAMSVATHAGLKKGAVILGVAGVVGVVGFIATKFVIKPVIKKIILKDVPIPNYLNCYILLILKLLLEWIRTEQRTESI